MESKKGRPRAGLSFMMPPFFSTHAGSLVCGDALEWLKVLPAGAARLVIADPPYNAGRAAWDRFATEDEHLAWSVRWVTLAHRVMAPDGTLYICGFPESLARIASTVGPLFHSQR